VPQFPQNTIFNPWKGRLFGSYDECG